MVTGVPQSFLVPSPQPDHEPLVDEIGLPIPKRRKTNAEIHKNYRNRVKNIKKTCIEVPTTQGLARVIKAPVIIQEDHIVHKHNGDILIRVWRNKVPDRHIQVLHHETKRLLAGLEIGRQLNIGSWRERSKTVEVTADSKLGGVETWLEKNQKLFKSVSAVFKRTWPKLYAHYHRISAEAPLKVGAWSTVAINSAARLVHTDTKDYKDGYCWVVPFGDFEGGELYFPDLNITIKMAPQMLVAFQSFNLKHGVNPFTGSRYSLVFYQHQTMFFPPRN